MPSNDKDLNERRQIASTETAQPRQASLPESIGPYKILEKIGEGGMGTVYVAEQRKPIRRRVALKVIKLGMDTKQVLSRFEVEHHALAIMNHPNIARVFDAGATSEGRPYFVMEHVQGIPINDYCDRNRLTNRQRLDLFVQVCHGVQHAHQKGVIHRDLKPSNILVMMQDGEPVPKIIDFGVAKATAQQLTERTLYTELGQLVGTPAYMSPEQAEMSAIDIDTRSDVYSLGVILYELLVGALPFDPKTLREAGYAEIQRIIREVDPPKPSTRLSTLEPGDSTTAAQHRRTDARSLSRHLRGDLDWIILKALEKDRTRRYETANALALDIRRHLINEPVLAGPPGSGYRFKKFVRRNKGAFTAATIVLLVLFVGLIATSSLYFKADQARRETVFERDRAETAESNALRVVEFLSEMLASADPKYAQGNEVTVRFILDEATKRIEEGVLDDLPAVEATIRHTIGKTYTGLGLYDEAESNFATALSIRRTVFGNEHPDTLRSAYRYAMILDLVQAFESLRDAEQLLRETLDIQRRVLGPDHSDTLATQAALADVLGEARRWAIPGAEQRDRLSKAETLYRKTIAQLRQTVGAKDIKTLRAMFGLAGLLWNKDQMEEAEQLYRTTLEAQRIVLGDQHPHTIATSTNLARVLFSRGESLEGISLLKQVLVYDRRVLGNDHPVTLLALENLGHAYAATEKWSEAEEIFLQTVAISRKTKGDVDHGTIRATIYLAEAHGHQGGIDQANSLYKSAAENAERLIERDGGARSNWHTSIGDLFRRFERPKEEEMVHRRLLKVLIEDYGREHPWTRQQLKRLADCLRRQGKYAEEEKLRREAHAIARKLAEKPHASANDLNSYAWDLLTIEPADLRDPTAALPVAQKAVELSGGKNAAIMDTLALAQQMTGDIDAAVETGTSAVRLLPPGPSLDRTNIETKLAKFLIEQGTYAEAEPLLLALHQQLEDNPESLAKQKQESIERIVRLYDSWHAAEPGQGYDAKAAEWRAKSPKTDEAEPVKP